MAPAEGRREGTPAGGGSIREVDPRRRDEVLPEWFRLSKGIRRPSNPHGAHPWRPRQAGLPAKRSPNLRVRQEPLSHLPTHQGQQPPRADDGARHPGDLRGHQEAHPSCRGSESALVPEASA